MKQFAAIFLIAPALVAGAQTNNVRVMSLQDCFAEALAHNFDVQKERYTPLLALYGLHGSYGAYDPTFNFSAQHTYDTGDFNVAAITNSVSTNYFVLHRNLARDNAFNSDLGGALPWGMVYDFKGSMDEQNKNSYFGQNNTLNSDFSRSSSSSAEVDLTQPLLKDFWIDGTRLTIRVAKNNYKASHQKLRQTVIDTITAVENAYYDLIYARDYVKVQQEALDLAQKQLDDDQQRVQVGSLAPLDVQQDQAQVAQSRASLIDADYKLASSQNALKNLITDDYKSWHEMDILPSAIMSAVRQRLDVQDSWNKGMTQRPDLLQQRLDVENQGITLQFDRNQLFPTLDLKGTFGYAGNGSTYSDSLGEVRDENRPYYSYGAQLSMPLSNLKARTTLKSDRATLQQKLLTLKQKEQQVMVDIDNAVKKTQSAWESVDATREARSYAEAALHSEEEKYKVGKSTTFTVLQLQNKLTTARSQEISSLADYNKAVANLAQVEGNTLVRRQIDFQVK
jgi:outer membrane protein TolC